MGNGLAILAHERLSIVDPQSGGQPLYSPDKKVVLARDRTIFFHQSPPLRGGYLVKRSVVCFPDRTRFPVLFRKPDENGPQEW